MSQKTISTIGWTLTILLGFLFTMSAWMKISQDPTAISQASSMGIDANTYLIIGIIEIISLILFIIPRTGIIGSLLLMAYIGGAIATHLQHNEPILLVVVIEIVIWITAFIRFPELKQRLLPAKIN